jgi:heat shock protein HslJ
MKKENKRIAAIVITVIFVAFGLYALSLVNAKGNPPQNNTIPNISNVPLTKTPAASSDELTSQKWNWSKTQMSDGTEIIPSTPGKFSITFQPDMRVLATTDCNNGNGSYELGADNSLTIGPMATTMMFCEGSTETQFYQGLANVGSYKISNGELWLMLKMDSGTMIFN